MQPFIQPCMYVAGADPQTLVMYLSLHLKPFNDRARQ